MRIVCWLADDSHVISYLIFVENENRLLADDSHVISYLIFVKLGMSSAAVVIGALRVNVFVKNSI